MLLRHVHFVVNHCCAVVSLHFDLEVVALQAFTSSKPRKGRRAMMNLTLAGALPGL